MPHFQSFREAKCGENNPPTAQLLPFRSGLQICAVADQRFLTERVCEAAVQPAHRHTSRKDTICRFSLCHCLTSKIVDTDFCIGVVTNAAAAEC